MTGWLIVAVVFVGVAFAFALAQMAHITPDDDSTCPEPDDVAKFASIVRHFEGDGAVALEVTVLATCAAIAFATCVVAIVTP